MTKVVNIRNRKNWKEEGVVYIGRGSMFGNPYKIGKDSNRDQVIEKYFQYFISNYIHDGAFGAAILELRDKTLGCYCRPKDGFQGKVMCHGQIIAAYLDGVEPEEVE